MKFYRYILIIFILITAFSCKKTTLTITSPGPDFFLGKMQSGNWDKVKVDGNKLTIDGKEYTFEDQILGVGGVYKGGDKGYIVAVPGGDNLYTVEMDEKAKESIDEIMNIVGEENVTGVMKDIINSGGDPSKVDVDKIASTAGVSEEEKKRLKDLFGKLDGSNFGNPNTIGPAKS
ncbi:hypothetical protein JQ824_04625 [Brachyspira hyodysenteriae]|uniref:Uncharacterized protein n=1 Tax=Brachyspira hyodysenteriae ATCC 27164 TaxID=1266923 RepID=A0A3B6VR74_BRAHO|nr:hypothetical protein [Brachyspira hyodysenteriae]ANN63184.1 hypothetical protein BHYOB78_04710 [Brachyspira hyodysenteriae ATCC 27164]KLI16076.1 hypothetical protein SU45_09325 [Brachyspira hyodysenteriae]KLI16738.1 hypothetical protein SU44_05095 [Brachyspira hyodysenteriae]KLI22042.1 hypothetical protein SU46_00685 [Brachyspira hyodysenteriae]KLI24734.1 hypothetical protein SZ47_07190 [Brachyspira hyodysenteriae]